VVRTGGARVQALLRGLPSAASSGAGMESAAAIPINIREILAVS
jgi:hypothetical protein